MADKQKVLRLALLLGLLFGLGGFGSTALAVVLPQTASAMNVPVADATWLISLYALAFAVSTPVYGRLVDLWGVRAPLGGGVALMATGATLTATATDFHVMLVARLLQGLGTGVGAALSVAVISTRFTGRERVRGLAISASVASCIGAVGPFIGGVVGSLAGWRVAAALPTLSVLVLLMLWRDVASLAQRRAFDVVGAALVSVGAAGIIMMLQAAASGPWVAMCGAVLTTLAAPLVILRSKGRPDGFLPASVLLHGGLVRICLVAGTVPAAWFALLVAVPARLSELGWSPLGVGAALLPSAATALVSPVLARHLADRLGSRGALTVAAALSSLALLVGGLGAVSASAPVMVAGVAVVSGAFGIGQPALFALVADLAAPDLRGVASGFASLVFMGCGSAGAAVVGGLGGVTSLATALLVLSAVCALGCLAAHSVTRRQGELTHSVVPSAKT